MMVFRKWRCFGAAFFVLACSWPAPAAVAATHTLPVEPSSSRGNLVSGEDSVLGAEVALPRGHTELISHFGLFWSQSPSRACSAHVFVTAVASPKPIPLKGSHARGRLELNLRTAAGNRGIQATLVSHPGFELGWAARFVLPSDLLSNYPRRAVTVVAGVIPDRESDCSRKALRHSNAIARSAVVHASVSVPATYTPPPPLNPPRPVDLKAAPALQMQGAAAGDSAGRDIAAAGDVNGDGLEDVVVSSPYADQNRIGPHNSGASTVVFGRPGTDTLNLGRIGTAGFQIRGPVADTYALPAAGIGDLDGDGLSDLVVGAPTVADGGGAAYVIRGSRSSAPVDLRRPGARLLFKVRGGRPCSAVPGEGGGDNLGAEVAAPGDMNGDGLPDLALLAPNNCADNSGAAIYIIFGKRDATTVNVRRLGASGITVSADYASQFSNATISSAGDVNGDGLADLAIGRGDTGPGLPVAQVVLGQRTGGSRRVGKLRFTLIGSECDDGRHATGAGDVNGDGLGDLVVTGGSAGCDNGLARAYVVFGTRTPGKVDLTKLGARGITISGLADSQFESGVAGIGDVNGDGLADVAVADESANVFKRRLAGEVFVVLGRHDPGTVDLRYGGDGSAFAWGGPSEMASLGFALAGVGDFNGDGRPDLLAGAPGQSFTGRNEAGAAYLLPMP